MFFNVYGEMAMSEKQQIDLVVCGAHMQGMALNHQLKERGARLIMATETAPLYRFYALVGEPRRPGLMRVGEGEGHAIGVEVWSLPISELGSFSKLIPSPLCLGTVFLKNGSSSLGFLCEQIGLRGAEEITRLGNWRNYLDSLNRT